MATKLKIDRIGDDLVWTDRASGRVVFKFDIGTVDAGLNSRVYEYGLKQILGDAAASKKTEAETVAAMRERAAALADGTWGQRKPRLPDGDIFTALVACGHLAGSDEARAKWAELKPAERRALGRLPDVVKWMEAHAADDDVDTEDLLAAFKQ